MPGKFSLPKSVILRSEATKNLLFTLVQNRKAGTRFAQDNASRFNEFGTPSERSKEGRFALELL